jgi:hypothetical protein
MTHIQGHHGHHHHHCHGGGLGKIIEGAITKIANDILGQFFRPMKCGTHAFPSIPRAFDVRCGHVPNHCHHNNHHGCFPMPKPAACWTAQMTGTNTAKVNLGDGYRLEIDERSSQMTIYNDKTGEKTCIWGDPHVDVDGKRAFDFYGTSTFTLENGTKITINTEQWGGNPNAYVASQVVITKGDNAMVIDGISQNKLGDLSITQSNNGRMIDAMTRDGWTVHENATGSGWRTEAGNVATQQDANATAVGREYGPGSQMPSMGEIGEFLGQFLALGLFAGFLNNGFGGFGGGDFGGNRNDDRHVHGGGRGGHHHHPDLHIM